MSCPRMVTLVRGEVNEFESVLDVVYKAQGHLVSEHPPGGGGGLGAPGAS